MGRGEVWTVRGFAGGEGERPHASWRVAGGRGPLSPSSCPAPALPLLRPRNGLAGAGGGARRPRPRPSPAGPRPLTPLLCTAQPPRAGLLSGGGGCAGSRLQAEMLQMDLIDAAGDTPGAEDDEEEDEEERAARRPGAGPPEAEPRQEPAPRGQGQGQGQGGGDTYRPKRPTTLNLFPQVPRSQVGRERRGAGLEGRWAREDAERELAGLARGEVCGR